MVLSDIVTSVQLSVTLAQTIQQLGERWYRTATTFQQFKSNVRKIEERLASLRDLVDKYALDSKETLEKSLMEINSLLEEEKAKLEKLDRKKVRWCLFRCQNVLNWNSLEFPSRLSASFQELATILLVNWKEDEERELAAEDRVKAEVRREAWQQFGFREDKRYVHLPKIEQAIKDGLNDSSKRVVLLAGRAGTGKSCMARHLALEYCKQILEASKHRSSATGAADPGTSMSRVGADHSFVVDRVFFLECGPTIDPEGKRKELLKYLGWRGSLEELRQGEGEYHKDIDLDAILKRLLKNQRVLIIFDDVWEEDFVQDMVSVSGDGVKIFVTSQKLQLWSRGEESFAHISMNVTQADAEQILQRHTGFHAHDNISETIQNCMKTLIRATSTNPHILASMATAVDPDRRDEKRHWEDVILGHKELLGVHGKNTIKIQGTKYSSSIQVKFRRLNSEEMKLMVLMSMCEGPSVPEFVIQLLSSEAVMKGEVGAQRSSPLFSQYTKKLKDLRCVTVDNIDGQYFWSIHFLDSGFLSETRTDDINSMLAKFRALPQNNQGTGARDSQEHLLQVLAVLYFKTEWADKVMQSEAFQLGDKVGTRDAIQGILDLMMKNIANDWNASERSAADQVILSYMCHRILHADAVKILLQSDVSKQIMVDAVIKIVELSDVSLSESILMAMLSVKGDLEYMDAHQNALKLHMAQCELLHSLALRGGKVDGHLVRQSLCIGRIVAGLLEICRSPNHLDTRWCSIETLGFLGRGDSPRSQGKDRVAFLVQEFPSLVSELASVLEEHAFPSLQEAAAWALYWFAHYARDYGGVKWTITEGAAEQLVQSIGQTNNKRLRRWAVWTLMDLVEGGRQNSLRIVGCPHAMDYIMEIIGSQSSNESIDDSEVRRGAVYALWNILRAIWPSPDVDSDMIARAGESLGQLLRGDLRNPGGVEFGMVAALTWIDPVKAKQLPLVSAPQYNARGAYLSVLGHYEDALTDLSRADELYHNNNCDTCRNLTRVKVKLGYADSALKDADRALKLAHASDDTEDIRFSFQERGVLKRIMEDLEGALSDLDEALRLDPRDYECLKHRAYVKYLMGNVDEARRDAEEATPLKSSRYDMHLFENSCLGTSTVKFLDFCL